MNKQFKELIKDMPGLCKKLKDSNLRPWSNLGEVPKSGIYVFYENDKPIYVGRTNRMRQRIKQHGQQSSTQTSATFAFNLALVDAKDKGINTNIPRYKLEKEPDFAKLFFDAKYRVSKMSVRCIGIDDQIKQTLFEVYAVLELGTTKYNDFTTH